MSPERRKVRLQALIERMNNDQDIAQRDLKIVLLPVEYAVFQAQWDSQKDIREYIQSKPATVTEYEELTRIGQFFYNKSEGYSNNPRKANHRDPNGVRYAKKFADQAQAAFERALGHLAESVQVDPSLQVWFDRPLEFGFNGNISPSSPETMPKACPSRSPDRQSTGLLHSKQSKRELKLQALQNAIDALMPPDNADLDDVATARISALRAFLRR